MIKQTMNILRKEIKQGLKARSILIIIFIPAIMSIVTGLFIGKDVEVNIALCPEVAQVENGQITELVKQIEADEEKIISPITVSSLAEAEKMLQDGRVLAVVIIPARLQELITNDAKVRIKVMIKKEDSLVKLGLDNLYDHIYQYLNLTQKVEFAVTETGKEAGPAQSKKMDLNELVVGFVATWILFGIFFITIPLGSELLAGEKDKKTFDALLISGVPYTAIIMGKALYVILVTIVTVLIAAIGVSFLGIYVALPTLLLLIPLTVLISLGLVCIGLSISAVSKNLKESKNLSVVVFIPLPLLIMLPTFLMPEFLIKFNNYFPLYHAKLAITNLLSQMPINPTHLVSMAVFDIVFLLIAIGLLRLEPSN